MKILRGLLEVLASVQLDNDPGFDADKVTDVDMNWMLPPELVAAQLTSAQATPKANLSLSLILAELAGEVDHRGR